MKEVVILIASFLVWGYFWMEVGCRIVSRGASHLNIFGALLLVSLAGFVVAQAFVPIHFGWFVCALIWGALAVLMGKSFEENGYFEDRDDAEMP